MNQITLSADRAGVVLTTYRLTAYQLMLRAYLSVLLSAKAQEAHNE